MLQRWTIAGFKSVNNEISIECAPVTVLVGANSSGKSSVLQALLIMKQTLQYGSSTRPILLNGPILKIGSFADVKNASSKQKSFGFGFTIEFKADFGKEPYSLSDKSPTGRSRRFNITEVVGSFLVGLDKKIKFENSSLLHPFLRETSLRVRHVTSEGRSLESELRANRVRPVPMERFNVENLRSNPKLKITSLIQNHMSPDLRRELLKPRPNIRYHGVRPQYFLPGPIFVTFDDRDKKATSIIDYILSPSILNRPESSLSQKYVDATKFALTNWLQAQEAPPTLIEELSRQADIASIGEFLQPVIARYTGRRPSQLSLNSLLTFTGDLRSQAAVTNLRLELRKSILQQVTSSYEFELADLPLISQATSEVSTFFTHYVRYLGPLRDQPKPLYDQSELSEPADIGYRGENTAAVFEANKDRLVEFIQPNLLDSPIIRASYAPLREAVVSWLSHMGVIEGLRTGDRGKFGIEMQVQAPGLAKMHDLTNVGVGVSQILPIIVLALLCRRNSVLVFEQPELHLHPRVQTRLADFFLSLSYVEKQCILETHSEYLIYRLRRRIAESKDPEATKRLSIQIIERERDATTVRPVEVNEFGAMSDWPADFFDQSQSEVEHILRASSEKRRARKLAQEKSA